MADSVLRPHPTRYTFLRVDVWTHDRAWDGARCFTRPGDMTTCASTTSTGSVLPVYVPYARPVPKAREAALFCLLLKEHPKP